MESIGAPPSYDDVVSDQDPRPSAPPPGATGTPPPVQYQREQPSAPSEFTPPPAAGATRRQSQNTPSSPANTSKMGRFVSFYTSYSMPRQLRRHVIPKSQRLDPELDVEAQFAPQVVREAQSRINKSMRLQCCAGWLWCIGVIQIFLYILIPIGMFITGINAAVRNDCPHNNDTIIIYLLIGASIVTLLITIRSVPSLMTCFRNRNYLNSANSSTFTGCICLFEVAFYVLATLNLVVLILGTVWIFQDTDVPECGPREGRPGGVNDCCEKYVYITGAFFNIFQYAMYTFTALYMCLVAGCIRYLDKVHSQIRNI